MKTEDSDLEQKIKKEVLEEIEETGWSKKQYLNDITKTAINLTYSKTRQADELGFDDDWEADMKQRDEIEKERIEQARKEEREKCEKELEEGFKEAIIIAKEETATEIFKEIEINVIIAKSGMLPSWDYGKYKELKGRWLK